MVHTLHRSNDGLSRMTLAAESALSIRLLDQLFLLSPFARMLSGTCSTLNYADL